MTGLGVQESNECLHWVIAWVYDMIKLWLIWITDLHVTYGSWCCEQLVNCGRKERLDYYQVSSSIWRRIIIRATWIWHEFHENVNLLDILSVPGRPFCWLLFWPMSNVDQKIQNWRTKGELKKDSSRDGPGRPVASPGSERTTYLRLLSNHH